MGKRGTHASVAVGLVLLATLALVPGVAGASGGGGCGGPVTDAAGTAVRISSFCFGPTILRVAPGQEVTFSNRDAAPHTVLGANGSWGGYEVLKRGSEITYRFTRAGVYPYVCTYHPGMVGAVVVGDGVGGAIDTTTATGPVTRIATPGPGLPNAAPIASRVDGPGVWPAASFATFALLLVTVGTLVVERRRRRSLA